MNPGVVDNFLNVFTTYIDSGFGLLKGNVAYLSSTLIAIDITLAGLFWAWGADEDIIARLVKKTLYIGFFAYIIGNFNTLAGIVFNSFAGLGLEAAGSNLSASELVQPGRFAQVGIDAGMPILQAAGKLMGFTSFFNNFIQIFVLLVAWLMVIVAFFVLAIQLFVTLIEFKLTTLAGFVLVPFGLFGKTAFLAEKVLGNVVASGVKVLVLAVIVGIGSTFFGQFTQGFGDTQPTIEDALSLVLAALSLLGLGIFGPCIATGLLSGAPQLGAGAAATTALAAGGAGAAGMIGTAGALRGGAGALAASARGGASLAGATSTAYRLGAATSGDSGMKGAASGVAGVAKTGAGAVMAVPRAMAARVAANLGESFAAGGRAAFRASGSAAPNPAGANAGPQSASGDGGGAPAWAQQMRRRQTASQGVSHAAQALRAGDQGGGSASINLSEEK
jgi:type IV secretion system protein TrbL